VKTRIITGIAGVPALLALLALFPAWVTAASVAVIAAVSAWELAGAMRKPAGVGARALYAAATGLFAFVIPDGRAARRDVLLLTLLFLALTASIAVSMGLFERRDGRPEAKFFGRTLSGDPGIGVFALPVFLASVTWLRAMEYGRFLVLLPFASTFLTDAGAYFTGVFFGRHKAFPRISPNKTVEGCVGGIFIGTAAVLAYGAIVSAATGIEASLAALALIGAAGAAAAEFGDLAFSLIKRLCGVKDYGKLLPGHGGMLDRFDSLVFCAPAVFIISSCLPVFEAAL
jgi:phosphatidate cytidylyltransferase